MFELETNSDICEHATRLSYSRAVSILVNEVCQTRAKEVKVCSAGTLQQQLK